MSTKAEKNNWVSKFTSYLGMQRWRYRSTGYWSSSVTVIGFTGHIHRFHRCSSVTFTVFTDLHPSLSPISPVIFTVFTVFTGLHWSRSPFSPIFTHHFHRFHRSSRVTFTGFTGRFHRSLSPVFIDHRHRFHRPPASFGLHRSSSPASIAQYHYDIESIGIVGISSD